MSDFVLSCCSTADLTKAHFNKGRYLTYVFILSWMENHTGMIWASPSRLTGSIRQ